MQHKKLLIIISIVLGVYAIVFPLILFSLRKTSIKLPSYTPYQQPTPSPNKELATGIVSVQPKDKATVDTLQTVSVTFTQPVNPLDEKNITLTLNPQAEGDIAWTKDNKTISFYPSSSLAEQTYIAKLHTPQTNYSWTFSVSANATTSAQVQDLLQQAQHDRTFGQLQDQLRAQYPWYDNFPLGSSTYNVFFDPGNKQFYAQLYPDSNANTEQQTATLKQQVLDLLKNQGVDTNKYPVNWEITPALNFNDSGF